MLRTHDHSDDSSQFPPNTQSNSGYESLVDSLNYRSVQPPTPQNYRSSLQSQPRPLKEPNGYKMHYQELSMDNGGSYSENQEYISYDDGEDFYDNGDGDVDTDMAIVEGGQRSNKIGHYSNLGPTNSTLLHQPASIHAKTDEQQPSGSAQPKVATPRSDSAFLNNRAAELRAKLLATRRGSTPGTPLRLSKNVVDHASDRDNSRNNLESMPKENLQQAKLNGGKIAGVSNRNSQPRANESSPNIRALPRHSPLMQSDGAYDIDSLFAEARATNDAKAAVTESSQQVVVQNEDKQLDEHSTISAVAKPNVQSKLAGGRVQHQLNQNGPPSNVSEPGEIKNNDLEPQQPKNSEQKRRTSNGTPIINSTISGTSKTSTSHKAKTNPPSVAKSSAEVDHAEPQRALTARQSWGGPSASHHHDRFHTSEAEPQELARKRSRPNQDLPCEHERNPTRESSYRKKDTFGLDQAERSSIEHQKYYENKLLSSKANVERNARAAAVYKKELEAKARRQKEPRVGAAHKKITEGEARPKEASRVKRPNIDTVTTTDGRVIPEQPISPPDTGIAREKLVASGHRHSDQLSDTTSIDKLTNQDLAAHSNQKAESSADLDDWLELTGFNDVQLRNERLSLFREMRATDARRAELQRKAEQLGIHRTPSVVPLESREGRAIRSIASPHTLHASSATAMPPPPVPRQEAHDEIGIKIKNSANRENPVSPRKLKRPRVEDDLGAQESQTELPRLDSNVRSDQAQSQRSPMVGEHVLPNNRMSTNDRDYSTVFRARSKSPPARRRNMNPEPRPRRRSVSPIQHEIRGTRPDRDFYGNVSGLRDNETNPSHNRDNRHNEFIPRWDNYQPNRHHPQNQITNNDRGRDRAGQNANQIRRDNEHEPAEQANGGELQGSASLSLQAGG